MNICDMLNILNWKWWKSNAPFDFKINSMVKTIKNITNMFCDAIFSHLRYIYEVKQFIELKNTKHTRKWIREIHTSYFWKSWSYIQDDQDFPQRCI